MPGHFRTESAVKQKHERALNHQIRTYKTSEKEMIQWGNVTALKIVLSSSHFSTSFFCHPHATF
jgi:hypothetical protein